jgi:hypothetical protein
MIAGDFIKDESGIWWLINVKAFTITTKPDPQLLRNFPYASEGESIH